MPEVYRTYKISGFHRVYRRLQGVYRCLQIVYRGFTLPFTGCKLRAWCPFNAFTLFINNPQIECGEEEPEGSCRDSRGMARPANLLDSLPGKAKGPAFYQPRQAYL